MQWHELDTFTRAMFIIRLLTSILAISVICGCIVAKVESAIEKCKAQYISGKYK